MNKHYVLIAIACTALGGSFQSVSYAADAPPASAETLFNEGVELLEKRRFDEACPKFEQSLAIEYRAVTLFALADCDAQWGHAVAAIKNYGAYLEACEKLPEEKKIKHETRMKEAHAQIDVLRPSASAMTIVVPAADKIGFTVSFDGGKYETKTAEIELFPLEPGDHRGVVQWAGSEAKEFSVTLEKGERRRLDILLSMPLKPEPPKPRELTVQSVESAKNSRMGYAALAGGLFLMGIGAAIGSSMAHPNDDERRSLSEDDYYRRESLQVGLTYASITSLVAATAVGGVTLAYAFNEKSASSKAAVRIVPIPGGLVVRGNWF